MASEHARIRAEYDRRPAPAVDSDATTPAADKHWSRRRGWRLTRGACWQPSAVDSGARPACARSAGSASRCVERQMHSKGQRSTLEQVHPQAVRMRSCGALHLRFLGRKCSKRYHLRVACVRFFSMNVVFVFDACAKQHNVPRTSQVCTLLACYSLSVRRSW